MIASIAPGDDRVALLSITRDLLVTAQRLEDLDFRMWLDVVSDEDPERTLIADTGGLASESEAFLGGYFANALVTAPNTDGALAVRLGRDWVSPRTTP